MTDIRRIGVDQISGHLAGLQDPRSAIKRQHPLDSVVVSALRAVLAAAAAPTAIARWAPLKEESLVRVLDSPHGVPREEVFRRVPVTLKPAASRARFAGRLRSLRAAAATASGVTRPVLAVDGKTARRSHDRKDGLGVLPSVRVWAGDFGLSPGQGACAEKSDEITAIPERLRLVDLKGAIVTIDAMGTREAIAGQIIQGEADPVPASKGDQETGHEAVIDPLLDPWEDDFARVKARRHPTRETGHGRQEVRSSLPPPVPASLPGLELWAGPKSIGVAVSEWVRDGEETVQVRDDIRSLGWGVKRLAHAIRNHGSLEESCPWSLDVRYREEDSRIRDQHLREGFTWLDRLTLSRLPRHPGRESLAMKRRSCGWSDDFLLKDLVGATP